MKRGAALAALTGYCFFCLSCPASAETVRIHSAGMAQLDIPAFGDILENETGISLQPVVSELDALDALTADAADLAVVENTRPFTEGVRTVLPLYRGVVHLAVRADMDWERFVAEQRPARVELSGAPHTARLVTGLLFSRSRGGSAPRNFEAWLPDSPWPSDFIVHVGPLLPNNTDWFREGFELVSMSRVDAAGAEFYTEGISHLHPQLSPERIPALTYALPGNETGLDALGVDMLMVARRDSSVTMVYRLVEVLLEQKARFAAAEPQLFRWLREDFPQDHLNFPLHQGTRDYLARNEPGFLERYAEALNFVVYLVALTVTGLVGFGRWRARARKDRIDRFYERLIELRQKIGTQRSAELLAQVNALEAEAFGLLVRERLGADDSFRILMDLAANLRRELHAIAGERKD